MNSRGTAAGIIGRWLETGGFPDRMMDPMEPDRAFVMETVYGVAKRKRTLEWVIGQFSQGKADQRAIPFLFVGLYQILYMTDVAEYAAVNETVEAAKKVVSSSAIGFVNAILRRALREKAKILASLKSQPLGVRESHPDLLVDRWKRRYTAGRTMRLCKWNNSRPDVVLCINTAMTNVTEYVSLLEKAGIAVLPHKYAPEKCFVVPHGVSVPDLPGYKDGFFSVQDPAMLVPVKLLGPKDGDTVLDACAAPGGKSMLIAEKIGADGELVAMDSREDRLGRLRDNFQRMKITRATVVHGNAAEPGNAFGRRLFDRVLVDAPCTNTGVLRRRADARWRFSPERLARLTSLQRSILQGVSSCLKPGGTLVYSVCSLEPEEGRDLVSDWLKAHAEFRLSHDEMVFPLDTGTDGMYAARIVWRNSTGSGVFAK